MRQHPAPMPPVSRASPVPRFHPPWSASSRCPHTLVLRVPPSVITQAGTEYPADAFRLTVRRQDLGTMFAFDGAEGTVGVRALVLGEINQLSGFAHAANCGFCDGVALAHQGDDAAVVVGIHLAVEEIDAIHFHGGDDGVNLRFVASFGKVGDALDKCGHGSKDIVSGAKRTKTSDGERFNDGKRKQIARREASRDDRSGLRRPLNAVI